MNDLIDIDWEQLHQVSEDDPEFELELLTMLAEDIKIHIADLHQAVIDRDPIAIAHEAHYIKGSSANVGIVRIAKLAKQIEQLVREQSVGGASPVPFAKRLEEKAGLLPKERLRQRPTENRDLASLVAQMTIELGQLEAYLATRI